MNPKKPRKLCLVCSIECERHASKYCSGKCHKKFQLSKSIESGIFSAATAKRYLLSISKKCIVCNITEWMGNSIVLELDHIDGDSSNNNLINLRLLCPNCHSQTPTYKNRNKGSGRHKRMERYRAGKSY